MILKRNRIVSVTYPEGHTRMFPQVQGWSDRFQHPYWDNTDIFVNGYETDAQCMRGFRSYYKKRLGTPVEPETLDIERCSVTHVDFKDFWLRGKDGVWLGGGKSTAKMAERSSEWFDAKYDIAVVANGGWEAFVDIAKGCEYTRWLWVMVEREPDVDWRARVRWLFEIPPYFTRVILAHSSLAEVLHGFGTETEIPGDLTYVFVYKNHTDNFQPRIYHDALMCGEHEEGTVTLQVLHLLAIAGCETIDAYGCELDYTDDEPVHFYEAERGKVPDWQINTFHRAAEYIRGLLPAFEQAGVTINFKCSTRILQ